MLGTPRRPLRALLAAALAIVVSAGCDKKIDEPIPEARPLDPSAVEKPQGPPERVLAPFGADGRCVRKSPAKPVRTAPKSPDPRCPKDPEQPAPLRPAKVIFPDAHDETVNVEVAENDHDRQRGLMFRTSMPEDHGMIFLFDRKDDHAFWMHNTCIPLDMLFLDDDGLIVGIEENTPTMSDDTFQVGCGSKYVLELNAGWTRRHGIVAGQKVKLEGL
ncbi:MAG TPA: DUF192 domain-containing protein [Minicystis sp.]|nr:DUF192 domain-containing protein [Minicystis sp.]